MERVNHRIAQAYSEKRTLELRIAGAAYAPLHQERGNAVFELSESEPLLEAELSISRHLAATPNDPGWLQAKARVDLLDHNFEPAIQSLHRALEMEPDSPQLLIDLASGYFERGEAGKRAIDYGNAVEYLGEALKSSPNDVAALFNRAIVCERMYLYAQAIQDWQRYLKVDPSGAWSQEAAAHLEQLRRKISEHDREAAEPLLAPSEFKSLSLADAGAVQRVEQKIEEYIRLSIIEWLPVAYPSSGAEMPRATDARAALQVLARLLKDKHRDNWLADLLSTGSSPRFSRAVSALARAAKANEEGNTLAAKQEADHASLLFASMPNLAGALRAAWEYIYASHIAQDGDACLRKALNLRSAIEHRPYPWLRAQYHLESGTCSWLKDGNLGRARDLYQKAADEAQASDYRALFLRAQDHLAAAYGNRGDFRESSDRIYKALQLFWSGSYPPMRGYNLYYNLQESARLRRQAHLQMAASSDGLNLSDSFSDRTLQAMAHSLMGNAASASGEPNTAEYEFALADRYFSLSPAIKSTRIARLEAETRLAEVEIGLGKLQESARHLIPLEPEITQLSDNFLGLLYYTNLGELQSRLHDDSHAESSLRSAIFFAEQDLQSLKDERAKLDWNNRSSSAYRNLVDLRLRQGDVSQALGIWEWYRGAPLRSEMGTRPAKSEQLHQPAPLPRRDSRTTRLAIQPPEVPAMLSTLAGDTTLSFMRLRDKYVGWVYDDRGIAAFTVPATAAYVDSIAGSFRRLCSDPKSDIGSLQKQAHILYGLLIAPAEAKTSLRLNLSIETDGTLNGIPFEALMDLQGRYLGERNSIRSSLGLLYRSRLHTPLAITAESRALLAVVPASKVATDPPLQPLPDAVYEGEMIQHQFHSAKVLEDQDATLSGVRSGLARAELFHFAGHAVATESKTGLLLWDTLLDSASLKDLELKNLQLAVLSGCDTAGEMGGAQYNPDNLVHPFVFAGVPRVVASRWNVDSAATKRFMELFYQDLLKGKTAGEALSSAEAGLRANQATQHPYYWAAFTEFGMK